MLKFFIFVAIQVGALSLVRASCLSEFIVETENQTQALERKYLSIDSDEDSIQEINRPFVLKGSKREAVFLVHGFMGSPEEMRAIAQKINALGYTTYAGLIPGYGMTARVANQYQHADWSRWYRQEIQRLQACYPKIHLVGFSTGALLATDYVVQNPNDSTVKSVTLLSPYYEIHNVFLAVLQSGVANLLNQISVNFVYHVLGFPDVGVMLEKPMAYLQNVPLGAAQEVVALGRKVQIKVKQKTERMKASDLPVSVPALVFISGDDLVIDQDVANELTLNVFSDRKVIYRKAKAGSDTRVPHHLMVKEVSPVVRSTENRIVEFYQSL